MPCLTRQSSDSTYFHVSTVGRGREEGVDPSEKQRDEKTTSRTQIVELSSRMVREMKDSFSFLFSLSVFLY